MASTITRLTPTDDSGAGTDGTIWNNAYLQSLYDSIENGHGSNSYTPTWTGSVSNPAIGNGTLSGRYFQIGKWVYFDIQLVIGSTTTFGSGNYSWALPVTAANSGFSTFAANILDSGTQFYIASGILATTTTIQVVMNANANVASPTNPMTWANGDTLRISGGYIAA